MSDKLGVVDSFEKLSDLRDFDKDDKSFIVRYPEVGRLGFFTARGKFSAPESMFHTHGTLTKVLLDYEERGLVREESEVEVTKPRLVQSNYTLLKNLQLLGYQTISTFVRFANDKMTSNQMSLLTNYVVRDIINKRGKSLKLKLNRNTEYYKRKASKLADFQDGGSWEFFGVNYHVDGTKCSLGHDINWEFIAHETELDEYISFGSTCVQDFFNVNNQVLEQLDSFKGHVLNNLLDYSFNLGVAQAYNFNIVKWQYYFLSLAYEKGLIKKDANHKRLIKTVGLFADENMLLPPSLQEAVTETFGKTESLNRFFSLWVSDKSQVEVSDLYWKLLVFLGIYGNGMLDLFDDYQYNKTLRVSSHVAGSIGLFGTILHDSGLVRGSINRWQLFNQMPVQVAHGVLREVFILLNNTGSKVGFDNLINNMRYMFSGLSDLGFAVSFGVVKTHPVGVYRSDVGRIEELSGVPMWKTLKKLVYSSVDQSRDIEKLLKEVDEVTLVVLKEAEEKAHSQDIEKKARKEELLESARANKSVLSPLEVDLSKAQLTDTAGYPRVLRLYNGGSYARFDRYLESHRKEHFDSLESWSKWLDILNDRGHLALNDERSVEVYEGDIMTMGTLALYNKVFEIAYKAGYPEFAIGYNVTLEVRDTYTATNDQKELMLELAERLVYLVQNGFVQSDNKAIKMFMKVESQKEL